MSSSQAGDHHCVMSRLHGGALLLVVKQCRLIAPLCRLSRSAEHAPSTVAVHQMTQELASINYNNNDDSNDNNNENNNNMIIDNNNMNDNINRNNNSNGAVWLSLLVREDSS
jgi:ABC-type antimicrobial peptide transport system permease subunit